MVMQAQDKPERLVKSLDRVRDIGEVFTPLTTVNQMLDLLPADIWRPHPSCTFLEPACGDGNFLEAILDRKLRQITIGYQNGALPAGEIPSAAKFHALEAIASIYAVDISEDNVIGGVPGHEIGARSRLLDHLKGWHKECVGKRPNDGDTFVLSAQWIIDRNVQVGNMLPTNADGSPSNRESIPLVSYDWMPVTRSVTVSTTTLGAVMATSQAETNGTFTLFNAATPTVVWNGKVNALHQAPIAAPVGRTVPRNGNGSRP